jgi:predicted Zn-dependent protease
MLREAAQAATRHKDRMRQTTHHPTSSKPQTLTPALSHGIEKTCFRLLVESHMVRPLKAYHSALTFGAALFVALQPVVTSAQQNLTIIRDAEIEQLLRDYATPVFKVSGINEGATKIILVGSRDYNAFVASGRKVFMNAGVIMESPTPNQVIGVMAHETGHIAGGHLFRLRQELERAQILAVAGTLLGAGAVVGSARSGNVGASGSGPMGAVLGGVEFAKRTLLAYQRSEEQAADKAALRFLAQTGQSGKGMIETFERFSAESLFRRVGSDPYLQSHPSAPERISALKEEAQNSPHFNKRDNPALQARHDLARGKLIGFLSRPEELARRYAPTDTSLGARYARAISAYRFGNPALAQSQIDSLIKAQPNNAYFWELKGQAHLESGKAREAVTALRRAVALAPGQHLIRGMLGHALVSTGDVKDADAAIKELTTASQRDPESPESFQHLARAYSTKGNEPMAALSGAQSAALTGLKEEARRMARRAMEGLKPGTASWNKADEIFNQKSLQN